MTKPRITIIVLTYERHDFIRRQLVYYANHPVHLIFADGSAARWPHGEQGAGNEMSWEYIYCPGYETLRERLALATKKVVTEYVCLLDDQECILWTGIASAIKTLDAEPEHSCAGGLVALHRESDKYSKLVEWSRVKKLTLLEPSPLDRFRKIVGPKQLSANLVYQVIRTEDLKNFSSIMRNHCGNSTATHEVALAGFLSLKGKYSMGNYPYWIRNGGTVAPPEGFEVIIQSEEIQQIVEKIINILNLDKSASNPESFDSATLSLAIESGWGQSSQWYSDSRYYLRGIRRNNKTLIQTIKRSIISTVKNVIPKKYIRVIIEKKFASVPKFSFLEYASTYSDNSYEVIEDLLSISTIWTLFPNGVSADYWPKNL